MLVIDELAILGVGLLGGSVALAARRRGVARRIVGVETDPAARERALSLGLVDAIEPEPGPALAAAEIVVCCVPVDRVAELLRRAADFARPGTLLTDVGSTKGVIVSAVEDSLPGHVSFVGSHPLAGSEKGGPEHASARLFEGRVVVVTPTERTPPAALERIGNFWQALGARVLPMNPQDHDRAVAVTSHLPHLVSSTLARMLPPEMAELAASGFRDTTRLAAGDPVLWTAICLQNRSFLLRALGLFVEQLEEFRRCLEAGDERGLHALLTEASQRRQAL